MYLENITDEHAQKVFEKFNLKNLSDYHDLYVQSDTLLLADVFENFKNKCIEIYELYPGHFLSAPGLAWQACLKETGIRLELLTGIDMLLMVENRNRDRICHAIHRHAIANNKYMKNYDKNIESSYVMYLGGNRAMSQKLPINDFEWLEESSEFDESFIKNYDEISNKGYILEVDVKYPKGYLIFIGYFHLKERKLKQEACL